MNTSARPTIVATASTAPRLLEQLMQIARASALEELASGIAHELNQSLGAIATFAQTGERMLARPAPLVSEACEVLHHIGSEALKAGKGIHRVRELFERSNAPRCKSDLSTVVAEVLPLLEALAQRHGVELQATIQPELPLVAIDRLRIQHVLFTLVQNALESPTSQAVPVVSIDVKGDRYSVITRITDEGAGISADIGERLFRPFFTTKDHGTGLGLASSRAIIEAHEGTIGFDVAERGASFWFKLPAATVEDEDGDAKQG
jgi:C4-dicarboxylate-specific signal transduction histidine kinase